MLLHGAVVILIGLLAGFPYVYVISGQLAGEERAWRMAHLEGILNGLVVMAVAAGGARIALSAGHQRLLAASLIVAAYGNAVASILGAVFGVRGLGLQGPVANLVVFLLFSLAIVGILLGLGLVIVGVRRAASGPSPE
jgi:hypothetical protein